MKLNIWEKISLGLVGIGSLNVGLTTLNSAWDIVKFVSGLTIGAGAMWPGFVAGAIYLLVGVAGIQMLWKLYKIVILKKEE